MAETPEDRESNTISMVVKEWLDDQEDQLSDVHRINGYPWRLRLSKNKDRFKNTLSVICDKSKEAELWQCTATFDGRSVSNYEDSKKHTFTSWEKDTQEHRVNCFSTLNIGDLMEVNIKTMEDGKSWRVRTPLNPLEPRNHTYYGILVVGEEEKKIEVNKEFLASQSPFFDKLFNSEFKERNMSEIPIGDVEYEHFFNFIMMVYGSEAVSPTDRTLHRILKLADRFETEIVLDRVASYLLSSSSSISVQEKLLISEQYNIPFLREILLSRDYTIEQLEKVGASPEWDLLSNEVTKAMYTKICSLYHKMASNVAAHKQYCSHRSPVGRLL